MTRQPRSGKGTGLAPVTVNSDKLLANGTDEVFRRLINDLHAIKACLTRISVKLDRVIHLPASQHHILRVIAELGTAPVANVNRVADILHMNPTQVTRELSALVRRRLVKKTQSPHDKRQVLLTVTDRGMQILRDVAPVLRELNETLFGGLSKEDFATLCRIMKLMTDRIDRTHLVLDWITARATKGAPPTEAALERPWT
jgi:MarR family transcriptional regulator, organic hydroperoxide resistance regulator